MKMEFSHDLEQAVKEVNDAILPLLPEEKGQQKSVMEAMNYSVKAGGKRIRPMILMKSFEMFSENSEEAALLSPVRDAFMTALESIHTFSLCHDDLPCMDGDKYRRGQESTWYHFGEDMGTLAGDALSLYAFELIPDAFDRVYEEHAEQYDEKTWLSLSRRVNKATYILSHQSGIYGMLGGQVVDVEMTGKPLSEEQLMFIYKLKTGALLSCAFMAGAALAGAEEEELRVLSEIGDKIGIAFQIEDDVLDETSTVEVLGKPIHSDEENGKTTYVTLHGLEASQQEVSRLSEEAVEALSSFQLDGSGKAAQEFLISLTKALIHRKK